ncbi:hypothetical protein MBLNU230_g3056t1 [Neophaeotheca triangularis]
MAEIPPKDCLSSSTVSPDTSSPGINIVKSLFSRNGDGTYTLNTDPKNELSDATSHAIKPHKRAVDILRQVDHYFSEDNLKGDEHLLALTGGDGNGPVSVSTICGFNKMKRYKPIQAVVAALQESTIVKIIDNEYVQRREPMTKPLTVLPKLHGDSPKQESSKDRILREQPWMTKNMLKATGFEEDHIEGPIEPKLYAKEREWYAPEIPFSDRIEKALQRFTLKRKLHQQTKRVFDAWMEFGGIDNGPRQFQGNQDFNRAEYDEYDKEDIADRSNKYGVNGSVTRGLGEDCDDERTTWIVDFAGLAKAFLSSQLLSPPHLAETKDQIFAATNVMRTFYRYLDLHDVCPEYKQGLLEARAVCDLADEELPKILELGARLPGQFNVACSTLNGGHYAGMHSSHALDAEWAKAVDVSTGLCDHDANAVMGIHTCLWVSEADEWTTFASLNGENTLIISEEVHMVVRGIERADSWRAGIFQAPELEGCFLEPTGKLICERWTPDFAAPVDLSPEAMEELEVRTFEFFIEDKLLDLVVPGMGLWAVVKELDCGIKWLDSILGIYPTFFVYIPNERIKEWKEPGPPKEWMKRQIEKKAEESGEAANAEKQEEEDYDDDELD